MPGSVTDCEAVADVAKHSRRQMIVVEHPWLPRKLAYIKVTANPGETVLRIPFGNKDAALQLGARYRTGGWYAPPGTDLYPFQERGWL